VKRIFGRCLALLLLGGMLFPLLPFHTAVSAEGEALIYSEDFSRFDEMEAGRTLSQADGFAAKPPSTTAVQRENGNTFLRVDIASGHETPDETVYYLPDTNYTIVDAETEGALCTDRASYGLISGVDPNIDKNLTLKNNAVSYAEHSVVVLEAKYYFSEDAKGSKVTVQLWKHSVNGENKGYLTLFHINPETGALTVEKGTRIRGAGVMKKGAWNTVSYVLDLERGTATCYLNYVLHSTEIDHGIEKMGVSKNSMIVGKVHRTRNITNVASRDLSGYFCVDDVRIYTPSENDFLTVPEQNAAGDALSRVEVMSGETVLHTHYGSRQFFRARDVLVCPQYFDTSAYDGILTTLRQEIRTGARSGIRFVSTIDTEKYECLQTLCENGEISDLSFGTLIAPAACVGAAGAFTVAALETLDGHSNYITVPATYGEWYEESEGAVKVFAGSLTEIHPSHYDDVFMGSGYVSFRLLSGVTAYIYSEKTTSGLSIGETADMLLGMGASLPSETAELLKQYRSRPLKTVGGAVDELSMASDHLFFRLHGDVYAAIVYTGNGGWRLRAQTDRYLGFGGKGASQALSVYMNEEPNETVLPIEISYSEDGRRLYLLAEDSSYLCLDLGETFSLRAYSPTGGEVSCLTDIALDGERITVRGSLEENEGIFGGGERFDSINRRGMITRLYTTDGWNKETATYMVVPLFLSTRGGGLFFNRFEDMIADFGATVQDQWALEIKNDRMDLYLFATDDMSDAISAYTALSGYADLPEEWSYGGVMLCRYAKDLSRFETDNMGYYYDNAPSGRSVKTLITSMMEAGMKPSSVIMEAWSYGDISADTPSARANREELQKTIDWLESHGIKTLLYMRMGGSFSEKMKGFDESYFLHAYITRDGETTYTNKIVNITDGGLIENPDVSPTDKGHWYIDFTNPAAVQWFYDEIWGQLIEMGVDGVKIDFCEEFPDEEYSYGGNMTVEYDWYDPSVIPTGGEHHSYPSFFMSSFYKRMNELKAACGYTDGFYVLSRGGGIGSQRNPYIWAGDQCRVFSRLDFHLMATVSSGLSGVPFVTYDMAGYRYDKKNQPYEDTAENLAYESEVFARAIEYTAFTVIIQTHGTVRNAYEMTEQVQKIYRLYCDLHAQLTDYIGKYVEIACATGIPAVRHPVLEYQNDKNVYAINDQFLLGDGLMVAPILTEATDQREVYLPEGSWTNLLTGETVGGGEHYTVCANLGQVPLFLNNDSEDAELLRGVFSSEAWKAVMAWAE